MIFNKYSYYIASKINNNTWRNFKERSNVLILLLYNINIINTYRSFATTMTQLKTQIFFENKFECFE